MYQQVIIDHARECHGLGFSGPIEGRMGESHQVNPVCGDDVRLRVRLDGDRIASVSWEGHGCSISQASVSVLHDLIEGATLDEAAGLATAFRALMDARGEAPDPATEEVLGDGAAFVGVGRYPARIKCALLGWMALKDALIQAQKEES
ncbi:MAG: SUF system NifU family Fe-S cluster assembly protein [Demequinaceae bacterium]|nr:SUF system NifU family Fe-S cluster assembly protein [Demequinaceae bacterium]